MNLPKPRPVRVGNGTLYEVSVEIVDRRLLVRVRRFVGHHAAPDLQLDLHAAHALELGAVLQQAGHAAAGHTR